MRLCDRYLLREFLFNFLFGLTTAVLLVIGLRFQSSVTQFARENTPLVRLLTQIGYDLPTVLEMALPVATALGAALATNRLARDNEITVLRGTGTSLFRLFLPFLLQGIVISALGLYTANVLQPQAIHLAQSLPNAGTALRYEGGLATRAGQRSEWLVQFNSDRILGTRHQLDRVCLIESLPDRGVRLVTALSADYASDTGLWTLQNAQEYHYDASGKQLHAARFPTRLLSLKADLSREFRFWDLNQQSRFSFRDLTQAALQAQHRGEKKKALELETGRWFKLSLSSMCFVFAICTPPIVLRFSRAGSFAGVLLSIILVFVAWNTVLLMKSVALSGWIPPTVCAFATHALFLFVGLTVLARSD